MSSGPGQVVVVGGAQEAEAVGQDLEHALAVDEAVLLGLRLQDGEDQLLLAHVRGALDAEALGDLRQLADLLLLQHLEVQALIAGRQLLLGLHLVGAGARTRRLVVEAVAVIATPTFGAPADRRSGCWPVPPDDLVGHRSVLSRGVEF